MQGVQNKVSSGTKVHYAQGCALTNKSKDGFKEAQEIAEKSDVIIMVLGISARYEGEEVPENVNPNLETGSLNMPVESEARGDRLHMNLPGVQEDLLEEIHKIGKPIVLVLTSGSALSVNFAKENIPAIVQTWYPGEEGGTAVADVIFGDYNPAGRLPVTFYKSVDQLPPFEDYNMEGRTYRYFKGDPLYAFGYGLSYTNFKYSNLQISPDNPKTNDNITISVDIKNIGEYDGDEVVQLYLSNISSPLNLPIRALQRFKRVNIEKGDLKTIQFVLTPKNVSYIDEEGQRIVEAGEHHISVGGCQPDYSKEEINIVRGSFKLVGEKIILI